MSCGCENATHNHFIHVFLLSVTLHLITAEGSEYGPTPTEAQTATCVLRFPNTKPFSRDGMNCQFYHRLKSFLCSSIFIGIHLTSLESLSTSLPIASRTTLGRCSSPRNKLPRERCDNGGWRVPRGTLDIFITVNFLSGIRPGCPPGML